MGMNVSDTLAGTFKLKASATIAINDAVGIGPDGRGYPIAVTDYAAVTNCTYGTAQTSTATGRIITETALGAVSPGGCSNKKNMVQSSSGNILIANALGSTYEGLQVKSFSAAGSLLGSLTIRPLGDTLNEPEIILLANGNYAVLGQLAGNLYYSVITSELVVIKPATLISGGVQSAGGQYDAVALSGGGFAVSYNLSTGPTQQLATFDNAGTAVLAPTTIKSWSGAANGCTTQMRQLSSGNLAIVCHSQYSGSPGTWHGVFQPDSTPILAFANLQSLVSWGSTLASLAGYYAVLMGNATDTKAWVFNNAGVLQGAGFSLTNAQGLAAEASSFVASANEFFAIYKYGPTTGMRITRIPVTGTGYSSVNVSVSGGDPYNKFMDAFIDGDYINVFTSGTQPFLWRYSTATNTVTTSATTPFGTNIAEASKLTVCIALGDSSFAFLRDASGASYLVAGKYANTSIAGVAASSAVENGYVNMYQAAGTYPVNTLKGSPAVAFDHTTGANINGNKGTILTNGLVLKGM